MSRPLPWTDLVAAIGEARFADIRSALAKAGTSDLDRDAFVLDGTAGAVLKDLVPEGGPAEGIVAYGALLHMLYVCWARDWPVVPMNEEAVRRAASAPAPMAERPGPAAVCYVQLPERLVWAEPEPGAAHEPADGVFVVAERNRVRALAVLGLRTERDGFTTMEADLPLPATAPRPRADGSAPFAPVLPGGDRARLVSVVAAAELVALALQALEPS